METNELLNISEVAAILRVPTSWLYSRTCPGSAKEDGPPFLKLGRLLRFRRSEILAWLEGHHSGAKPLGTQPEGSVQAIETTAVN
jgi:predicted DNA-binding transcriptional regulator AlpA